MLLARTQWPIYFAHNKNLERPDSTVPYVITRKLLLQLVWNQGSLWEWMEIFDTVGDHCP